MATILAAQLAQIAAKSSNPLDLKAQKRAHSKSLLFDQSVAATQDFDNIYQICLEGYQELCQMDKRFIKFARTIFSEQSRTEERAQLTAAQNKDLDEVLESFLWLVSARILLRPALKAIEWLIRRFRSVDLGLNTKARHASSQDANRYDLLGCMKRIRCVLSLRFCLTILCQYLQPYSRYYPRISHRH